MQFIMSGSASLFSTPSSVHSPLWQAHMCMWGFNRLVALSVSTAEKAIVEFTALVRFTVYLYILSDPDFSRVPGSSPNACSVKSSESLAVNWYTAICLVVILNKSDPFRVGGRFARKKKNYKSIYNM